MSFFRYIVAIIFVCILSLIEVAGYNENIHSQYDSTYLKIETKSSLEFYKKYIGQQLFLPKQEMYGAGAIIFSKPQSYYMIVPYDKISGKKNHMVKVLTDCYHPVIQELNGGVDFKCTNDTTVFRKYYDIIDVISGSSLIVQEVTDNATGRQKNQKHKSKTGDKAVKRNKAGKVKQKNSFSNFLTDLLLMASHYEMLDYFSPLEDGKYIIDSTRCCFVLREIESSDTVYTLFPDKFIINGGLKKLQQEYVGKTFVSYNMNADWNDTYKLYSGTVDILDRWECKNLKILDNNIFFIMENIQSHEENHIKYPFKFDTYESLLDNPKQSTGYAMEKEIELYSQYLKHSTNIIKTHNAEPETNSGLDIMATEEKRKHELINKYGQELGEKIYNQELSPGMSREMFHDMNFWIEKYEKNNNGDTLVETYTVSRFGTYIRIILENGKISRIVD